MKHYSEEFKKDIVRQHLETGRTIQSLVKQYNVSKASISIWVKNYREECQTNETSKAEYNYMSENRKLRKQLAESQKENQFLKKAAAFFAKEID